MPILSLKQQLKLKRQKLKIKCRGRNISNAVNKWDASVRKLKKKLKTEQLYNKKKFYAMLLLYWNAYIHPRHCNEVINWGTNKAIESIDFKFNLLNNIFLKIQLNTKLFNNLFYSTRNHEFIIRNLMYNNKLTLNQVLNLSNSSFKKIKKIYFRNLIPTINQVDSILTQDQSIISKKNKANYIRKMINKHGLNKTFNKLNTLNKLRVTYIDPITINEHGNHMLVDDIFVNANGIVIVPQLWTKEAWKGWEDKPHPVKRNDTFKASKMLPVHKNANWYKIN